MQREVCDKKSKRVEKKWPKIVHKYHNKAKIFVSKI